MCMARGRRSTICVCVCVVFALSSSNYPLSFSLALSLFVIGVFWRRLLACLCVCSCGLERARVLTSGLASCIDFTPGFVCVETRTTCRGLRVFAEANHRVCLCVCRDTCGVVGRLLFSGDCRPLTPAFLSFFFFSFFLGGSAPPKPPSEQTRPKGHERFPLLWALLGF